MTIRVCPERDGACPHGLSCPHAIDRYHCDMAASRTALAQPPSPIVDEVAEAIERANKYLALTDDQWETMFLARSLRRWFAADIRKMAAALVSPPKAGDGEPVDTVENLLRKPVAWASKEALLEARITLPHSLRAYTSKNPDDHDLDTPLYTAEQLLSLLPAHEAGLTSPSAETAPLADRETSATQQPRVDGVRVKPLEWSTPGNKWAYKSGFRIEWTAETKVQNYAIHRIEWNPDARPGYLTKPYDPYFALIGIDGERYESLADAQAAAQLDYETRIRSALEQGETAP